MIPLPRAWLLASAMLMGVAVGFVAAVGSALLVSATIRPDVVIALVVGIPGTIGMLMVLLSGRRWVTTVGVLILSVAPGWFGALAAIEAVSGA